MYQDVGIAEQQKVGKDGRDDSIKQVSTQPPYISCFHYTISYGKYVSRGGCVLNYLVFSTFLLFCYPYML